MHTRRSHLATALATAVASLLFTGGIAAVAQTAPPSGAATIQACVHTNGNVRIVSSASDCRRPERSLTWSTTGPVGPAGPQGEQGPPGPAGADGAGLSCENQLAIAGAVADFVVDAACPQPTRADLAVVEVGGVEVEVRNLGPSTVEDPVVTFVFDGLLPPSIPFADPLWTCDRTDTGFVCTLAAVFDDFAPGETARFSAGWPGTWSVSSEALDPNPANDSATV